MNKILTVIVPTYNMEKYLRKCLNSLIIENNEVFDKLEVLVINDGSKDSSSVIAHEYETKFPNVFRVIDKENGNYGSCINRGLKEMKGTFVKVLDADDYFDTNCLEKYLVYLQNADADLVLTDYNVVDTDGKRKSHIRYSLRPNDKYSFADICGLKCILGLAMHGVTYKSDIFSKIDYTQSEGISYTDQEWIFTPMSQVKTVLYYPVTLYQYLVGREGQTMDPIVLLKSIEHTEKGILKMLDDLSLMKGNVKLDYFYSIILKRIKYIYSNYLISSPRLDTNHLIEFDQMIKQKSLDVYNLSDKICYKQRLPIKFVKLWRENNYNSEIMSLKLLRRLHKFFTGI